MTTLAEEASRFGSVAVAGLAKNVGKTVTLNHLLREWHIAGHRAGVTSVGVDGESVDRVTGTGKPEIRIRRGTLFATGESLYRVRQIESEVLAVSRRSTALGRVVTARSLSDGKAMLAGPSDTAALSALIGEMRSLGARTVAVDGALSRVSPASPDITEALVLATGAALSPDIRAIAGKTAFVCSLISLPEVEAALAEALTPLAGGMWGVDAEGVPHPLGIASAFEIGQLKGADLEGMKAVYASGLVSDGMLKKLASRREEACLRLIARDFTKFFVEPATLKAYKAAGGVIEVVKKARLIAVTVNPWSPAGYTVSRERLISALEERIVVPVVSIDPATLEET